MTIEHVREICHATPFRPFVIHLADGREISVRHPEFVLAPPEAEIIIVYQPDHSFNIIDLLLVTEIEVKNGRRRQPARPSP